MSIKIMVIRRIISFLGYLNVAVWGLIMTYTLIMQWYAPNNTVTFYFNNYGESFLEHIMGIIMFPCTLYYLYRSILDLKAKREYGHDDRRWRPR